MWRMLLLTLLVAACSTGITYPSHKCATTTVERAGKRYYVKTCETDLFDWCTTRDELRDGKRVHVLVCEEPAINVPPDEEPAAEAAPVERP